MKYKIIIVLFLITSCRISFADPNIDIFLDVYEYTQGNVVYKPQLNDEWKIHSEIDLSNVDCDGIALWMGGEAIERGVEPSSFWYGIFKYRNEDRYHMAILYDKLVIPSSGLQVLDPFMPLDLYLDDTQMDLIESFQLLWE